MKYFAKLFGITNGFPYYETYSAEVNTTQDLISNIPLLNKLFEFPESETGLNETYFNKLRVPQHCDDDYCGGVSRKDFIEYYQNHSTLMEELLVTDCEDDNASEVYAFNTDQELYNFLFVWLCDGSGNEELGNRDQLINHHNEYQQPFPEMIIF